MTCYEPGSAVDCTSVRTQMGLKVRVGAQGSGLVVHEACESATPSRGLRPGRKRHRRPGQLTCTISLPASRHLLTCISRVVSLRGI